MISLKILRKLSDIVGSDHLSTLQDDLESCASDGTKLVYMPEAVAYPGKNQEISRIFQLANEEYFPIIPRGAGSGMSGGALPVKGGVVLSMERFNRVLSIDQENLIAKVEPGIITARLQEEAAKLDLYYPPDPASADISTIGGNVAECAGGLKAVKYGVTRDYVLGLTVVLPTGEIIDTGVETVKGVAGYDLTRLIVGSEGTLAIITSITLRLIPRPQTKKTMTVFYRDLSQAVSTVSRIITEKIIPTALELLDRLCLDCVREEIGMDIPKDSDAMLLIEVDGDEILVESEVAKIKKICREEGSAGFQAASEGKEADRLWEARRNVSPSLMKLRPGKISEDVVVPRSRLTELISFLSSLGEKHGLPIPAFGHAGDGNIHVNIMLDKENPKELEKAEVAVRELFGKVIAMGGTITGEHGIGITKAPYLEMEISRPALELMSRIKKAFDPKGILNPGKMAL
ncbi:FAD-binding oxidoreductase [Thermodesulfobacteriota bacterium]